MKNYLLFLLSFFLCVLNVSAQKYEIECARGDSANVYPASIEKMDYEENEMTFDFQEGIHFGMLLQRKWLFELLKAK